MPAISINEATKRLTHELEEMHAVDDIVEVYNELFPANPVTEEEVSGNVTPVVEQIMDHVHGGLEVEEILDLWNVVFPKDRNVYYDEESDTLHYNEDSQALWSTEQEWN